MTWLRTEFEAALNDVVKALREAADRAEAAAERTEDSGQRGILQDAAVRRETLAEQLVQLSEAEAAVPDPDAEFVHEIASTVKSALAGDPDRAVADDVLQGEDMLENAVMEALAQDPPADVKDLLQTIQSEIRGLREALDPANN